MFTLTVEGFDILKTDDEELALDCYREMVEFRLAAESDEEIRLISPNGETLMVWTSPLSGDPEKPQG